MTERALKAKVAELEQKLTAERRRNAELLSLIDNLESLVKFLERQQAAGHASDAITAQLQKRTTVSRKSVERVTTQPSRRGVKRR